MRRRCSTSSAQTEIAGRRRSFQKRRLRVGWVYTRAAFPPSVTTPHPSGVVMRLRIPALAAILLMLVSPALADELWTEVAALHPADGTHPATFRVDLDAMRRILGDASRTASITLPLPDGRLAGFRVTESSILSPALRRKHPEWRTFRAISDNDPLVRARLELTPKGLRAAVFTPAGAATIDPLQRDVPDILESRWARDGGVDCEAREIGTRNFEAGGFQPAVLGDTLRRIR